MQRLTPRFIDVHVATLDAWAGRRRPAVTSIESLVKCRLSCAVTRPYTQARIGNIAARSRGRRCEPTYQVGQVVALALMTFSMPASSMRPLCLRRCHSLFGRSSSRLDLHVAYQLSNGANHALDASSGRILGATQGFSMAHVAPTCVAEDTVPIEQPLRRGKRCQSMIGTQTTLRTSSLGIPANRNPISSRRSSRASSRVVARSR